MSNSNNILRPNNLFDLENTVMQDLTNFNKKYAAYLRCGNNHNLNIDNTRYPCSENDKKVMLGDVEEAYTKLVNNTEPKGSINKLNDAINAMGDGGITNETYAIRYKTIIDTYSDVVKKRQSIDANLAELYEIGDTRTNFYQRQLMTTSYTKILLTIIASTLTVVIFLNMRKK
jgi:hypothetical protein